jgi:glutathione synthase/RimK-type ligase-like ATP-grasp enzyme
MSSSKKAQRILAHAHGSMNIATSCRFSWESLMNPFAEAKMLSFLFSIQLSLLPARLFAFDWRSIQPDGKAAGFDVYCRTARQIDIGAMDVVHIFNLGYPAQKQLSLKAKWQELEKKLAIIQEAGCRCVNSVAAIRYGINKNYLVDLAARDFPVVPTSSAPSSMSRKELKEACGKSYQILKPANGECGRMIFMLDQVTPAILEQFRRESDELLLQPYLPEIMGGEKSLLFFGEQCTHAVWKIPSNRDIRSNGSHTGAIIQPYLPMRREIQLARMIAEAFPHRLDIFRVDIIESHHGPLVMEVETVDPGHYWRLNTTHARRLAAFYKTMLRNPELDRPERLLTFK